MAPLVTNPMPRNNCPLSPATAKTHTEKNPTNPELETPTKELPTTFHLKAKRSL